VPTNGSEGSMLTKSEVVPYLMKRALISADSIVQDGVSVVDVSQRNHNLAVRSKRGPSYLLKQGIDPERKRTIANEAAIYELLGSNDGRERLNKYLPRCYGYDSEESILILEYLPDAENLNDYSLRSGRFSRALASAMGDALAALHQKRLGDSFSGHQIIVHEPPAILSIHRPDLELLREISSANLQVVRIVQQHAEFKELFDALREDWRGSVLVHFDLKWDNFLVIPRSVSGRKASLKIVDWELSGVGDPDWDLGSIFSAYIDLWIRSIPITGTGAPDEFFQIARFPLDRMQPAMRMFWQSYARRMSFHARDEEEHLLRAVRYASARLTQSGYEQMQTSPDLSGSVVCSLQLSLNMLSRPRDAVAHLLGIDLAVQ
jgi:thiamine kinase-like enzyme